ncbi:MAG: hypothetical protein NVSMB64_33020 [Candidatus Velthaea sp.]
MRSLLTRLAALSVVAVAVAGCAGSSGTALPIAGPPNSSQVGAGNSQTNATTTSGTGGVTAPANTILPLLLDGGTLTPKNTYVGSNATALDVQSAANSTADGAPAPPEPSGVTDAGSHAITISNINSTQALVTTNATNNLTYGFGGQQFTFSSLVAHFANLGGAAPTSVSAEIVGGAGSTAYDARVPCTGTLAATFSKFTCTIPAYGTNANSNSPNAVTPGVTGAFTPNTAKVYFVLNYAAVPAGLTTTIGIDNVYILQ